MATSVNEMYNTEDRQLRWAEHGSNPRAVYLIDAAILCKGSLLSVQLSDAWTQHVTGEAHSGSFYNNQLFIVLSQYLVEVTFSDGESAEVVVCCSYLQSEFMQNVIQNKHLLKCANLSVSSPQRSTVAYFFWPETESGLIQFKGLK